MTACAAVDVLSVCPVVVKAEHEQCLCIGTGLFEASLLSLQGVMLAAHGGDRAWQQAVQARRKSGVGGAVRPAQCTSACACRFDQGALS